MAGRASENGDIIAFIEETGVGGFDHVIDHTNLWSSFEITSQPAFAFIDDDGSIETHLGRMNYAEMVDRIEALAQS